MNRILITGAEGFIGSHLTEDLIKNKSNEVSIYIRDNSNRTTLNSKLKNLDKYKDKLKNVITGNIGTGDVINIIKELKPHYIFHLAADAFVDKSFKQPLEVLETNLLGTIHILEATRNFSFIKRTVCTSSSEIYGLTIGKSINEEHPLYPSSPYAASKVSADRYCYSYIKTYNIPVSVIRPFNTYGPRHTYDVIPKFISLAIKDKPLTIYGNGKQSRDFTYVDDMVRAFKLMATHKKTLKRFVNFGSTNHIKIIDLAKKIIKISKSNSNIVFKKARLSEVPKLNCNYTLAKKLTKWKPLINIDQGLKLNIAWFLKNKN